MDGACEDLDRILRIGTPPCPRSQATRNSGKGQAGFGKHDRPGKPLIAVLHNLTAARRAA